MSKEKYLGKRSNEANAAIVSQRKDILSESSSFLTRESYKTLRTNVNFALADQEGCKVIAMTSSMQSEGKSISTLNVAISFAEAGNKVLTVDCDLRRPKLARLVGISSSNGLTDLLIHPELEGEVFFNYRPNLDVLLSGRIPPNPSELLGSARMENLLSSLRERYDYIILDTPPVNVVTDAAVLSRWTDGILFIVRAGQTERGAVAHALDQLNYAKARVLGFVFNGVDTETTGYTKYRYKGYGKYGRYGRYGRYGYGRYGYSQGRGGGYEYGHPYGYGYGQTPDRFGSQEAYEAVRDNPPKNNDRK